LVKITSGSLGLWRNGIALDYESRDSRFDPEQARFLLFSGEKDDF
jgi:hypothetical protein